jgi:D-lactate dehydrogenase
VGTKAVFKLICIKEVIQQYKISAIMKVAIFSTKLYEPAYFNRFNSGTKHQLTYFDGALTSTTVSQAAGFDAVCVFVNDKVDREAIVQLAKAGTRLIALRCAGFNNVDIAAAAENHITVMRVPAYSPQAVAEHAVAIILTLNRKTHKAYNRVRENNFSADNLMGFNLYGKTVGVIGAGKIGAAFCHIMLGFGCKLVACDIIESDGLKEKGVVYKSIDALLGEADIISLHCPLTAATRHLFNSVAFGKMKTGAMLINTGRGALINSTDAINALKSGRLGYLGIDVYEEEENLFFRDLSATIVQDDILERLMTFSNVLITPHVGFFTKEALDEIAFITIKNFTDFDNCTPSENEIVIA